MLKFYLLHSIGIISSLILQTSLIEPLQPFFHSLNLLFVGILCFLFLGNISAVIYWTLIGGFLFDYFSFLPFGFYFIILVLVIIIMYLVITTVLATRSIYSLLLFVLIGLFLFNSIQYLIYTLIIAIYDKQFVVSYIKGLENTFWQFILSSIFIIIVLFLNKILLQRGLKHFKFIKT